MFACRGDAVVASATRTEDLGVVYRVRRCPDVAVMAVFADVRRLHMSWRLARGLDPVVAAYAVAGDADVIKVDWSPGNCHMAIVARITAHNMRWMLADCRYSIVTRITGTDDLCVIDAEHWRKHVCVMAVLTNVTA